MISADEQTVEGGFARVLDAAENALSRAAVSRLASLLACAEFGLTELELLELLMPANHSNAGTVARLDQGHCNFSTLCAARSYLGELYARIFHSHSHVYEPSFVLHWIYIPSHGTCHRGIHQSYRTSGK
jgi:hypothetical protein